MTYTPYTADTYVTNDVLSPERQTVNELKTQNGQPELCGSVPFDAPEFKGSTDELTFSNVLSYAGAQSNPPVIRLANRQHSLSTTRIPYNGFRLAGSNVGPADAELSSSYSSTIINLSTNGNWLNVTGGNLWNATIRDISFVGSSDTTFLGCDGSSIFHGGYLHNLSFKGVKTVLGTQAQKLLMTTCLIDGWFQMQGTYNGGIHIGGSDNRLFLGQTLVDASQSYNTSGNAAGQFHFWFDGFDNSVVGGLYITCSGLWGGIKVTGTAYNGSPTGNRGMFTMYGVTVEGQAASNPCFGAVMRVEGGLVKFHGGYIARGMTDPTKMGHSPTDAGLVHQTGGYMLLDGPTFDRANGIPVSSPVVYQAGGTCRVINASVATTGGSWSGLPQIHSAGGTMSNDDTVTKV